MKHQFSKVTKYNRYPEVFAEASEYFKNFKHRLDVLSFGCSDGSEIRTLSDLYFKNAHFVGCDYDYIDICSTLPVCDFIHADNMKYYGGRFDCIFAMSVLCRYSETEDLKYDFNEFEDAVIMLDKILNKGGLLVIYNSNYCLKDSSVYHKYRPLKEITHGFVPQRNKDGGSCEYNEIIFIKIADD